MSFDFLCSLAAISAIPKIVCETIHALELHDETPSWKIMDNKGRVTVVLHWDQRQGGSGGGGLSSIGLNGSTDKFSPSKKGLSAQSSLDKTTSPAPHRYSTSPQITIINHDDPQSNMYHTGRSLSKGSGSFDSGVGGAIHVHSIECSHHIHTPTRAGSPGTTECDFHCCALHEEGRKIAVHKNVATSPIQDGVVSPQPPPNPCDGGSMQRRTPTQKGHVRFLDIGPNGDSSESETENTVIEDESITTEKFLLLIDQLSVEQKSHLSIKDIGIILERLSSKIIDVERLDRETDSDDCYNWTIKATIRGDTLRELGVIYNGNYYAISEHPGYKDENEDENEQDEQDDEEEQDHRL